MFQPRSTAPHSNDHILQHVFDRRNGESDQWQPVSVRWDAFVRQSGSDGAILLQLRPDFRPKFTLCRYADGDAGGGLPRIRVAFDSRDPHGIPPETEANTVHCDGGICFYRCKDAVTHVYEPVGNRNSLVENVNGSNVRTGWMAA